MLQGKEQLQKRFEQLDCLITRWKKFWQLVPFHYLELPWEETEVALSGWLSTLDMEQIGKLDSQSSQLAEKLSPFILDAVELDQLAQLGSFPKDPIAFPQKLNYRIPKRKWAQIVAFASSLEQKQDSSFLEWCSGKGHLGRLLAWNYQQPIHSLELNPVLCKEGEELANHYNLLMNFQTLDVLSEEANQFIEPDQHVVALHACGKLHLKLITEASAKQSRSITIAPCCYQKIGQEFYSPLSSLGKKSSLKLGIHDLKLPLQECIVASPRIMDLRDLENNWRLGFDLLQRKLRGINEYQTVPSIQKSFLEKGFSAFCQWAAEKIKFVLPQEVDYELYERKGKERRLSIARTELVRHLFRRPLELWLILDRALFLVEQGYQVSVGEFCEKHLTPRNILIKARRDATSTFL